jgi:hypothetical protein
MIKQPVFKSAIVFMIIIWIWAHCVFTGFITMQEITFWNGKEPQSDIVNAKYHLDKENEILYLDAGDAPYFFRANSSCRYSTPLPYQRDDPTNWSLEWMPQFQDESGCISNYQGKYIIMDANGNFEFNWIGLDKTNRAGLRKLLTNYTRIWDRCWFIYQKNS